MPLCPNTAQKLHIMLASQAGAQIFKRGHIYVGWQWQAGAQIFIREHTTQDENNKQKMVIRRLLGAYLCKIFKDMILFRGDMSAFQEEHAFIP